jgi:thiol:disulfide interchange protein
MVKGKRILFATLLAAFCGSFAVVNGQTVTGSIAGGAVTKGKPARATVLLNIPGGLHVNSSRPNSEYAIPTTVRASAKGVRVSPVMYPRGVNRKFEFSENAINVYEGRPSFWFNVTVPESYKGDTVAVTVSVRYQACTNEVCYPPRTRQITLRARVKQPATPAP